jgi:hypothetical protein
MQNQPRKLLDQVSDAIRTIQEFLDHKACPEPRRKDIKTTMIYTHVFQRGGLAVIAKHPCGKSPLDG